MCRYSWAGVSIECILILCALSFVNMHYDIDCAVEASFLFPYIIMYPTIYWVFQCRLYNHDCTLHANALAINYIYNFDIYHFPI